jgi:hypothetical protein
MGSTASQDAEGFVAWLRALLVHGLIRLGQDGRAGQFLAGLGEQDRERDPIRVAAAALRLARDDPQGALAALAPVQEHPVPEDHRGFRRGRSTGRRHLPGSSRCWSR